MNILEENDEKPICTPNSYFLAIPVDLKVGTNIQNFKLTCTDLDSSPRSFRYSIGPGMVLTSAVLDPVWCWRWQLLFRRGGSLCSHTDLAQCGGWGL